MESERQDRKAKPILEKRATTCAAKYVFLDVVQFTHERNVEAQSDIVDMLTALVLSAMSKHKIYGEDTVIFIPTGDGLCIALMNTEGKYDFDIHMSIALDILASLHAYNNEQPDEMRRFQIRIGINANEDNLITDINGRANLAGAGISLASRIMDNAEGGQIMVGDAIFDRLQQRERYMNKFRTFSARDKHGKAFGIHQYVATNCSGLNVEPPSKRASRLELTQEMAFYLAHAIRNKGFIVPTRKERFNEVPLQILLHLLARDECARKNASELRSIQLLTWKSGEATFEEQFRFYEKVDLNLMVGFWEQLTEGIETAGYGQLFEIAGMSHLFVNSLGRQALKEQYPEIWGEFNLDKYEKD
jgi:class 3 adenylate cyclase